MRVWRNRQTQTAQTRKVGGSIPSTRTKYCLYGEIGKRSALRTLSFGLQVQVLLETPNCGLLQDEVAGFQPAKASLILAVRSNFCCGDGNGSRLGCVPGSSGSNPDRSTKYALFPVMVKGSRCLREKASSSLVQRANMHT